MGAASTAASRSTCPIVIAYIWGIRMLVGPPGLTFEKDLKWTEQS